MKITKELFRSFKGLEELKKMKKEKDCNELHCQLCPLDEHNLNNNIGCTDIIDLDGYAAKDLIETKRMSKLIDIFTEEKINKTLSLIDEKLKYNSKVIYNGKSYKIKGVLKKKFIKIHANPILLNGFDDYYDSIYDECIVKESDMKKKYTLWVDIKNIEI